jgi:hypothetical protein
MTATPAAVAMHLERLVVGAHQLTDARVLSGPERARIAAEDGVASLTRILRRAELAGHDPTINDPPVNTPYGRWVRRGRRRNGTARRGRFS